MMKSLQNNTIRLIFSLFTLTLISSCSGGGKTSPEWTVMLYMAADNNLEPAVARDLEEVRTASIHSKVNVIIQVDTRSGSTKRYRVANGNLELLADLGELDMSYPDTLRDFVAASIRDYPAPKTALILWGHGNGWQSRVDKRVFAVAEDLSGGGSRYPMSNRALTQALSDARLQTGQGIDILGFDACIMATLEAAFEFRSSASFLVASQELVQGNGWNYKDFLSRLSDNPEMGAEECAKLMVRSYADYAESLQFGGDQAISAVRLGAPIEALALAVDKLAQQLLTDLDNPLNRANTVANIQSARAAVQELDRSSYPGMYVDLLDFSNKLNTPSAVAAEVYNVVMQEYHGNMRPNASGISIVFVDKAKVSSYSSSYYYDDYKNYDPLTGTGSLSSFVNLYAWDEFMAEYYLSAGLA